MGSTEDCWPAERRSLSAALPHYGGYSLGLGANSEAWMRNYAARNGILLPFMAPRGRPITSGISPDKARNE